MKATVTQEFTGRADEDVVARRFGVGETVTGDLAAVAVREGWAKAETAAEAAPAARPKAGAKK